MGTSITELPSVSRAKAAAPRKAQVALRMRSATRSVDATSALSDEQRLFRNVSASILELRGLFGTPGRISGAVGMGARAGEFAAVDNEILVPDRSALEPAFEDLE